MAYLVYQDLRTNLINKVDLSCNSLAVDTKINSFNICLGCYIPNPNNYN